MIFNTKTAEETIQLGEKIGKMLNAKCKMQSETACGRLFLI